MTPEVFFQQLGLKNINLTESQMQQFQRYYQLLCEWNEKINLTAITAEEEVYEKHFFDSLTIAFTDEFQGNESLCDVGSGAGFPSIPLKIVFPDLKITIVDSLNKRISFLTTLVDELQLEGVQLYHERAEDFGQMPDFRESFDLVTARAVARLNVLTELCLPLVKKDGYFLAMKAVKSDEELAEAKTAIARLGGKLIRNAALTLPISGEQRQIIVIQKKLVTPKKYPRKAGLPNKQPIK